MEETYHRPLKGKIWLSLTTYCVSCLVCLQALWMKLLFCVIQNGGQSKEDEFGFICDTYGWEGNA
jgi:hypothetical protein